MTEHELAAMAKAIVDANLYMVLGTADESGRPWVSPVYFAPVGYREFIWVSKPEARHSRNIATRSDVSIVIFDSTVPINTGQGVYMSAVADELTGSDLLDRYVEVFSRSTVTRDGSEWTRDDVEPPERLRLYRATASEHWLLDANDQRQPVQL